MKKSVAEETNKKREVSQPADARAELDVDAAFREHAGFIGRVLMRLTGDGPHVDDLLQETFIVAHRKRAEFEGRSSVRTWLYSIAARLAMRHGRDVRRFLFFKSRLQHKPPAHALQPDETVQQKQLVAELQRAIAKLPFKQREVFVLFELEDLDGADIAAHLAIPVGTVWTRLHAARKTLARLLQRGPAKDLLA